MLRPLACLLLLPAPALAANICDSAALMAAAETGVPPALMQAITRVETGRDGEPWPWTLNINGKGHFFDSSSEAVDAAEAAIANGATQVDIGCFQLNLQWHGARFDTLTDMIEPHANAFYAAQFLLSLHAETGDWRQAAAAYHSRTPARGEAYVGKIEAAHAAMAPGAPTAQGTRPDAPNRFPLLMAGATGGAGSLVPQADLGLPLIGGP